MPTQNKRRKPRRLTRVQLKLFTKNEPLVTAMLARVIPYLSTGSADWHDAMQEGRIVLLKSCRGFDPARGIQFSTYACRALVRVFLRHRAVRQAAGFAEIVGPVQHGKVPPPKVYELKADRLRTPDDDERPEVPPKVAAALDALEPRWRHVIEARYIHGRRLADIGLDLGVTRERVRQIEVRALRRVRVLAGLAEPDAATVRRCRRCFRQIPNVGPRQYCRRGAGCRKAEGGRTPPLTTGPGRTTQSG